MSYSILLVDDEVNVMNSVQRSLRGQGYRFFTTTSGEDALRILEDEHIDVVLTDERMPRMKGHEFLSIMRKKYPNKVALMLSGYSEFENVVNAINEGDISHFISKPWNNEDLKRTVERACALADERSQQELDQQLASNAIEAYLQISPNGELRYANKSAQNLLSKQTAVDGNNEQVILQPYRSEHEAARWETLLHLAATSGEWQGPYAWPKGDKQHVTVDLRIHANRHGQDIVSFDLHVYSDEASVLEAHDKHAMLAIDVDSGLLARNEFVRRSGDMLNEDAYDSQIALMVIRIAEFNALFDSLGSQISKQLIYALAKRLRSTFEDNDYRYELGRISESDFALSLRIPEDQQNIESLCWEITHQFEQAIEIGEECVAVSTKVGLALARSGDGSNIDELVHRALGDIDKPNLKSDDCIGVTSALDQMLNCSVVFEKEFDEAIQHGHLAVEFQPQVNLMTNQTENFVAVIHWRHPNYGDIPAAQFVPRAEETGLIHLLDDWLTYECCQIAAKSIHQGMDQRITIPLSALEFNSDQALKWIQQTIQREANEFSMDLSQRLCIEISDSHLLKLNDESIARLEALQHSGVEIILGDFALESGSIDRLCELPLDGIKLGKPLINRIDECWKRRTVFENVLRMAEALDLKVLASDVENNDQLDVLRSFPNSHILIQSFIVGAPMSADLVIKNYTNLGTNALH